MIGAQTAPTSVLALAPHSNPDVREVRYTSHPGPRPGPVFGRLGSQTSFGRLTGSKVPGVSALEVWAGFGPESKISATRGGYTERPLSPQKPPD